MKNFTIKSMFRVQALCALLLIFNKTDAQVVAQNDLFNVLEGSCSNYLDVKANDNIDTNTTFFLNIVSQPFNGTVVVNGSYLSYCPAGNFRGADHFTYLITAGGRSDSARVYVNVVPFNSYVFPGDADQNGKVENYDVLSLGLGYNLTGPSRYDSASVNAVAWSPSSYTNINPGAADCNGDGIVNAADLVRLEQFYGDTFHVETRYDVDTSQCGNGIPFFLENLSGDSVYNGETLRVAVKLGNDSTINEAYGIAFTLQFDTGFIYGHSIQFSTVSSWLLENDPGLFFNRSFQNTGELEIAISKTNHIAARGGGQILLALIPIDDNIDGIIYPPGWYNLTLNLSKTRLVRPFNVVQDVCTARPTIRVYKRAVSITETLADAVTIYPNPANDKIFISAEKMLQLELTDIRGQKIYSASLNATGFTALDIKELGIEAGPYLLQVKTENGMAVKKIMVMQ